MKEDIKEILIKVARDQFKNDDNSHDINHSLRVLKNAEYIADIENADLDIVIPAAIFHDIICYPKNSPKSKDSAYESAVFASKILNDITEYPKDKIPKVFESIAKCSFTKGEIPDFIEGKILQDADRIEATGAISIMRTFASAGIMHSMFYNPEDPFCEEREPDPLKYAVDLFYARLLKVKDTMHTEAGKALAEKRNLVLNQFLESLKEEINRIR